MNSRKGDVEIKIEAFLNAHQVAAHDVDLIVDLGAVENLIPVGVEALTNAFLGEVPDHASWRTFTVSACAFPLSMRGVERHSHQLVERADWIAWRDNLHGRRGDLARLPSFSDCAIQHLRGVEGFDPRTMQVSASIRYAREQDWLLIKGESTRDPGCPAFNFQELATRLVYGHLKHCFSGPDHCSGCQSMKEAADGAPRYGSAGSVAAHRHYPPPLLGHAAAWFVALDLSPITDRIRNLVDTEVFADARPHDAPGFAANATRDTA